MDQHASQAVNALLATNDDYQRNIITAKQHVSHLTSEQKWELGAQLSLEQQQSLLFTAIHRLISYREFGITVAALFGQTLARYLYTHIGTVIPYVLRLPIHHDTTTTTTTTTMPATIDSEELLDKIASILTISTQTLYQDYGYLAIVHCLLLDPVTITMSQRQELLNNVFMAAQPHLNLTSTTKATSTTTTTTQIANQLLAGHVTRVTSILSVELWHPDHQFVLDALDMVRTWTGYDSVPLVHYLRTYMLSIVSHINQVLSHPSNKTHHHALASLIVLLDILGMDASRFTPQLLGIAQTAMEYISSRPQEQQEDYMDACCLLWNRLLALSGQEQSVRHFGDVIRAMVTSLPLCNNDKTKMVDELTQAIKSHALSDPQQFVLSHLPELPPYPELDLLRQWIQDEQQEIDNKNNNHPMMLSTLDAISDQKDELAQLIVHMSMNETIPSFHSLQKLYRYLTQHQAWLYTDDVVWPLLGELYEVLIRIIKQHAYRYDISGLAASCLGLLGAVDPSRLVSVEERQDLMLNLKKKHLPATPGGNDPMQTPTTTTTTTESHAMRYTNDMIVLKNYTDRSENQTFAIHLIVHYFVPTFYSTNNTVMGDAPLSMPHTPSMSTFAPSSDAGGGGAGDLIQSCSQYAVQELLKAVGIHQDRIRGHALSEHDDAWRLWHSLDPMIQEVMEPLSISKFEANVHVTTPRPPFFELAYNSFDTWTRNLCYFLLDKVKATAASDTSRQMVLIFQACIPSIKAGHVVLTQHLIPFLVLRLLLSSPQPAVDRQLILDEMVSVLNHGAVNSDMKQSTLQLIVSITGHCRQWIRQKLQQQKKRTTTTVRSSSATPSSATQQPYEDPDITSIKQFLAGIPHHLMAQAAFRTGNYPQALMHYELAIRDQEHTKPKTKRQAGHVVSSTSEAPSVQDFLDDLCQTYMHLEGPEAMAEVLSKSNRAWSRPLEVLRFESRGEWQYAKLAYEDLLPTDPTLTPRYFHCLRQLGDYEQIINYASYVLETATDETEAGIQLLKQVNRYRAEAAWKSSNWPLLHDCLLLPMDDSFDASVASVLAHMQKNQPLAVYLDLQQASIALIHSISQNNPDSYQQTYDAVLRFQLLHELESVMMLPSPSLHAESIHNNDHNGGDNGSVAEPVDSLLAWKIKFSMLKPSYPAQRQLLDLRLAAQFDIWKPDKDPTDGVTDTERGLRLLLAKTARKAKDMGMALRATYQANESVKDGQHPLALIELAKWYYARLDFRTAGQYLHHPSLAHNVKATFLQARIMAAQLLTRRPPTNDRASWIRLSTELRRVETTYADIKKKCPEWEKVHLVSGTWEEQRCDPSELDYKFYKRGAKAIRCYCDALKAGCRYYYSTMPRLLSLWLQIVDAMRDLTDGKIKADNKLSESIKNAYNSSNGYILESIDQIPSYLFALTLPRLVSRLAIQDNHVAHILAKIILNVLIVYPRTTIWALQFAVHSDDSQLKNISSEILRQAQVVSSDPLLAKVISQTHQFTRYLEFLSKEKCSTSAWVKLGHGQLIKHTGLLNMTDLELCIPQQRALIPRLPESFGSSSNSSSTSIHQQQPHHPYPLDIPMIANVLPNIQVMASLQRPKRISLRGSDGKTYDFLLKQNDDLRKDARMMEFSHMINQFLMKNATARQQQLYIRTYAVVPLSNRWGLIEWIDNLNPLKSVVRERWEADGLDKQHYDRLRHAMRQMEHQSVEEKVTTLVQEVYPASPLVFYRWFLDQFPEPSEWYASRSRYIRTLAVMSIVGYVLGLGDRHADNIMFDATNGDTVHVDVNLLFDYGQDLAVPEIVPFRLTRNLVNAMGTPKENGLFKRSCITTLTMLREYRAQLLSVFETFLHDPITDRRKRDNGMTHEQVARKEIDTMSNKIQNRQSAQTQVEYLIREASSDRNLAQMYSGWTAFI